MENKEKVIAMLKETYLENEGEELTHEKAVDMYHKLDFFADKIFDDWLKEYNKKD